MEAHWPPERACQVEARAPPPSQREPATGARASAAAVARVGASRRGTGERDRPGAPERSHQGRCRRE
jgi:hypothetical protein